MAETQSPLPPLRKIASPKSRSSLSSIKNKANSADDLPVNQMHLKREATRLILRIQNINKEISLIRQQLPNNLKTTIEKLSNDVKQINITNSSISYSNEMDDSYEVNQRIEKLEEKLLQQLNSRVTQSENDIYDRLHEVEKVIKKHASNNSFKPRNRENDLIRNIDQLMSDIQKKEQSSMERLEKNIDKLKKISNTDENLSSFSTTINSQSKQICDLRIKLSSIMARLDIRPNFVSKTVAKVPNEGEFKEEIQKKNSEVETNNDTKPAIVPDEEPFDADEEINKIREEMLEFKQKFQDDISMTFDRSKGCDTLIQEIENMSKGLSDAADGLDVKITEAERLVQELMNKMSQLLQKNGDESNKRVILTMAAKIKTANENIHNAVASIKSRVRKCEMSVPLVVFDP